MDELKELLNKVTGGWYFWPVAAGLFLLGLSPVAVFLIFWKLFANRENEAKDDAPPLRYEPVQKVDTRINKPKPVQVNTPPRVATGRDVQQAQARANAKEKEKAAASKKKRKRLHYRTFLLLGGFFAFGGLAMLGGPMGYAFAEYPASEWLEELLTALAFLAGGGAMFWKGWMNRKAAQRFPTYLPIIGDRDAVDIESLARTAGVTPKQATSDLAVMITLGYFGDNAYLNRELGYLFRSNEADQSWREHQRQAKAAETPEEAEKGYSGILRNIRRANDEIADPVLSEKIDRLEAITARIFQAVEADPKKADRIETFLTYYLPTTQKLLDSYAQFEAAGVEGENLSQAKARISSTMDMILDGFSRQLDALYRADAMDVDSDIRVMETMLRRDVGTVADDFGMTPGRASGGKSARAASSGASRNSDTSPASSTVSGSPSDTSGNSAASPDTSPSDSPGTSDTTEPKSDETGKNLTGSVLDDDPFGLYGGSAVQREEN